MNKTISPIFLYIETATEICSVALSKGDKIIACEEMQGYSHAEKLFPLIDMLFNKTGIEKTTLRAIVLSIGPGSYTGLRIGASAAKGFAYTLNIPVITISTLQSIMLGAQASLSLSGITSVATSQSKLLYSPMIDAGRMEVYTTLFNHDAQMIREVHAEIINETSFQKQLQEQLVCFCGNGMPKCKPLLEKYPNAVFSDAPLSARNMLVPALQKYQLGLFEDTAYFEPFYLKEYIARKSSVKGLR